MQQERRRVQREIQFEVALDNLRKPNISAVDIENSLVELSQVKGITYAQARQVLRLATNNLSSWVEVTDGDTVIKAVSPSIGAFRTYAEASDDERVKSEFTSLSSKIVAGFILAEPQSYSKQLGSQVRKGRFGEPKMVLSGLAVVLLDKGDRGEEYGEGHSSTIARVLDDVIALNDPELLEPIKSALPLEWLDGGFGEKDLKEQFPRVHQFLEQPLVHPEERHVALARTFVASGETQRERLKERIKQGEFDDAFDALGKVVGVLASHETEEETSQTSSRDMDLLTEDLWVELLEMNRRDPRLRPLRERFIGKEWYWDSESVIYTLTETMDGMAVPIGEEEAFIAKYSDEILVRLRNAFSFVEDIGHKYRDGLELTYQRGELNNRLAAVLEEVRQILRNNSGRSAEEVMPNKLLFASLYSPVKSREV